MTAVQALFYERLRLVRDAGRLGQPVRYGSALVLVAAVAVLRALLFAQEAPWFLFEGAAVLTALMLGAGPAVLVTLASAGAAAYAVADSAKPLLLSPVQWTASLLFILLTLGLVGLVETLRRTLLEMEGLLAGQARDQAALAERSGFLASVLASSTDCIKVLDLEGRLTFMSEGGQKVMEVSDFNLISGCPWPSFWDGPGNVEAVAAVQAARAGTAAAFIGQANTMGGSSRWWHVAVSPILGADGRPERVLSVSRDITALREGEAERDRYKRVIENSSDFIGMALLDGSVFFLNEAGRRLVGLEPEEVAGVRVADFFPPKQADTLAAEIFPTVDRDGSWSGERLFRHFKTGELIPVLYSVFPVLDAAGERIGFGTVTRDFRERKRAEDAQALVNGEISHRLKNVLAMVQALAAQTLKGVAEAAALAAFDQRLAALSRAQDTLMSSEWRSADLETVARGALELAGASGRCELSGPPVQLGARATLSASLLLHELATNAQKYGALSRPEGHVRLDWRCEGEDPDLVLDWRERGGPPATPPTRKGFGSRLLRLGLVGTGGTELCYEPEGFSASFRGPLKQVEAA